LLAGQKLKSVFDYMLSCAHACSSFSVLDGPLAPCISKDQGLRLVWKERVAAVCSVPFASQTDRQTDSVKREREREQESERDRETERRERERERERIARERETG
jgi:signal transduction histidine kinase